MADYSFTKDYEAFTAPVMQEMNSMLVTACNRGFDQGFDRGAAAAWNLAERAMRMSPEQAIDAFGCDNASVFSRYAFHEALKCWEHYCGEQIREITKAESNADSTYFAITYDDNGTIEKAVCENCKAEFSNNVKIRIEDFEFCPKCGKKVVAPHRSPNGRDITAEEIVLDCTSIF